MNWSAARWDSLRDYVGRDYYPSADKGIGFKVALTVRARVSTRRGQLPPNPLDLVVPAADRIIRPAAAGVSALRCNYLQHTIASELAELTSLSTKRVRISDVYARVTLDDDAAEQARDAQRMRHDLELDELARQQARARAQFIRDECLADPATARIYTLLEKSSRLGELAGVLDRGDLVAEVAQWHEQARPVLITQAIIDFFGRLTPGQSYEIVDRFIAMVRGFGATKLADQLQSANTRSENGDLRQRTDPRQDRSHVRPANQQQQADSIEQ
ncbi:hypothetical protein ACIBCH_10420 [Amycolatopsis thailandensis]|uniref:hypothetical protein n=1 Tax=Amycolatopsis thailandensis TaxID=589330 RepID=UPI0037A2810E